MNEERYLDQLAAAYVRGHALHTGTPSLPETLLCTPPEELSAEQIEQLIGAGQKAELKLCRFKASHKDLPRVRSVLGFLKGISFESLVDVGSGRGVFLLPFLTEFPWVAVTAVDILPYRVGFLKKIADGGIRNLKAMEANICEQPLPADSADVVTMLEVLEHIPDVEAAVISAVRIARKHVVVSVPSKPDNNPEHIHLLTKEKLTALFSEAGCEKLNFSGVNGHLIMIATVG
ncbi:MAG: class I SAM-dependent methyltransferase [Lachnospiraceae bacterium]|nr:class I SAM-dependent methyltransferase [Lachnospiraceae bacterium]